ncbi:MAG: hypothetical protein NTW97_05990, partial [Candidatus Krumholzibacteria bacterium]|nr:hypothetical protein [Candidatus Krumholzibacteria bacterium]
YLETRSPDEIDAFRKRFPRREMADQEHAAKHAEESQAGEPADYDIDEVYDDDIDVPDDGPAAGPAPEGTDPTAG